MQQQVELGGGKVAAHGHSQAEEQTKEYQVCGREGVAEAGCME